jgi:hypothetical protein
LTGFRDRPETPDDRRPAGPGPRCRGDLAGIGEGRAGVQEAVLAASPAQPALCVRECARGRGVKAAERRLRARWSNSSQTVGGLATARRGFLSSRGAREGGGEGGSDP